MGKTGGQALTKATIESLPAREKVYRVPDTQMRGLFIQVTPAGVLSWVLRFRVNGREKTFTIGRWPEVTVAQARKESVALMARIGTGENPTATKKAERKAETVAELVARFRKEHLPTLKPSTQAEYERLLAKWILPGMGSLRVKDVQPSDVARFLSRIRSETPKGIEANRTRATLSKMFSLAELWGLRPGGSNPTRGQVRAPETKKDRHLSDRELVALGEAFRKMDPTPEHKIRPADALPAEDPHALAALRLFLLTGMRKSELIGDKAKGIPALSWDAVDLEIGRIRLDHHKTDRKAGARIVPLCGAAMDLLEHLPKVFGNPHVIPGSKPGEALVNLQVYWNRVRAGLDTLQEQNKVPKKSRVDLSDVTIHDLRRSFSSLAARMGYPELIVGALLGHKAGTVTAGYARIGADPLRDVVETIGARMAALLEGTVDLEAEAKETRAKHRARRAGNGSHHLA